MQECAGFMQDDGMGRSVEDQCRMQDRGEIRVGVLKMWTTSGR